MIFAHREKAPQSTLLGAPRSNPQAGSIWPFVMPPIELLEISSRCAPGISDEEAIAVAGEGAAFLVRILLVGNFWAWKSL